MTEDPMGGGWGVSPQLCGSHPLLAWAVQWAAAYTIHKATPGRSPSLQSPGRFGRAEGNFIWYSHQGWWTTKPLALAKRKNGLILANGREGHISHTLNLNGLCGTTQAQQCPLTRDSKCFISALFSTITPLNLILIDQNC